ncbi:MAG: universal stress protein [Bacteroidia bacterium]
MIERRVPEGQKLKILIPTDFSGHALNAGVFAIELLKNAASEAILENVFQAPKENAGTLISFNDIISRESQERLNKERDLLIAKNGQINITVQSDEGYPVSTVKNTFKRKYVDLLVIGHNSHISRFCSSFIEQPEYWPALLVPGSTHPKIPKEVIIVSTSGSSALDTNPVYKEIEKRFKTSNNHHLHFTRNSTVEHLKTNITSLLEKYKIGLMVFSTTRGDRLEQAIKERHFDSVFISNPTLLVSLHGA